MDAITAKILVNHSEGHFRLYEDYSGRGMYGATTTGVVARCWQDFMRVVAETAVGMAQDGDDFGPFLGEMQLVRMDNLGRDDHIFY